MKKRVIGLDFGEKTTGVAVSDGFLWTAQPVCVIRRENEQDLSGTLKKITEILKSFV